MLSHGENYFKAGTMHGSIEVLRSLEKVRCLALFASISSQNAHEGLILIFYKGPRNGTQPSISETPAGSPEPVN